MLSNDELMMRRGLFTASSIHKLMGKKGLGETGLTYIKSNVAEALGAYEEQTTSKSIQWGNDLESDAIEYFSISLKKEVVKSSLIVPEWNSEIGCTPDGLIYDDKKGLEIKCPFLPSNHLDNLLITSVEDFKVLRNEYYWQVMMCLMITEFDSWFFASYDPRFTGKNRMAVIEITRNEADIELLKSRINEAIAIKTEILNKINN